MSVFDTALATLFDDPNRPVAGTWRAGGQGPGLALRVILGIADDVSTLLGGRPVKDRSDVLRIRVADVARVGKGDTVEVGETRYVVTDARLDVEGLTWVADTRRQ